MAMTRKELDAMLGQLDGDLPALMKEFPHEADFWKAFSGQAGFITDSAGPKHRAHVRMRIARMLDSRGLSHPESRRAEASANAGNTESA